MFFMLILVLAATTFSLRRLEGVGLAVTADRFYFLRKSAADAGKKAFIVNRSRFRLHVGMFLLFKSFGTLDSFRSSPKAAPLPAMPWAISACSP